MGSDWRNDVTHEMVGLQNQVAKNETGIELFPPQKYSSLAKSKWRICVFGAKSSFGEN